MTRHTLIVEVNSEITSADLAESVFEALKRSDVAVADVYVPGRRRPRGEQVSSSRLTERQVVAIRCDTRSNRALAAVYGVSHTTISQVRRHKLWGWVS